MPLGVSLGCHLGSHSKFRLGFICGFLRLTDGFFRVHLGFHVGVSYQDIFKALSFLWVAPRVFRVH